MTYVYALAGAAAATPFEKIAGWTEFIFIATVVLGLLIVAHEFGHFIVARLCGVRVERFSIGFGPKLFGRKSGDTEYMLCAVPLGGYVKFYGDESEEEIDPKAAAESFLNQPVKKRLAIVAAGPLFNIGLAVLIAAVAAMAGLPTASRVIGEMVEGKPAALAGFKPGDRIDSVNGEPMESWGQIQRIISQSAGKELSIGILRDGSGEALTITVTPGTDTEKTIDGKEITVGRIGVMPTTEITAYPPHVALYKGAEWTWNMVSLTVWSIGKMISREIPASEIAGPVGIMQLAGQQAQKGVTQLLLFVALISVNLGILNLLPIPVLDGGHILFYTIESVLGKPLNLRHQEIAQQVGIFLLLSLMVFAFYNDIMRIMGG
ncbi:MAG: RIP metalloprotease RseP [Nitrospinae bacterium]|nr:RIP metalloprotease RseP [Nitrospinota bacterium]